MQHWRHLKDLKKRLKFIRKKAILSIIMHLSYIMVKRRGDGLWLKGRVDPHLPFSGQGNYKP